jgi:OHCU decarboxylase
LKPGLESLNSLGRDEAAAQLLKCCGSSRWAERMAALRPFKGMDELLEAADRVWSELETRDWLEAFSSHPKIGERKAALAQSAEAARWSEQEQAGTRDAAQGSLLELAALNRVYEERFGFIYIVCATGRTTEELLALLRERLSNDVETELRVAAREQQRITRLRLGKLFEE